MKEKINPEGRELVMQTYQSFSEDLEELVRQKVAPLVGKTFTQREWITWITPDGKNNANWHTVKITVTHGVVDSDELKIIGEYTHPYTGKLCEAYFDPRR